MKVLNVHSRTINAPKHEVVKLLETLSTENDVIWPSENWPRMKFKGGIQVGAKGGHGPIRYSVEKYNPNEIIQFRFSRPLGFSGIHKFDIKELPGNKTEVSHVIDMDTDIGGTIKWVCAVRSLHNALIEDGLDKMENHFIKDKKSSEWNLWVRFLRFMIARKGRGN